MSVFQLVSLYDIRVLTHIFSLVLVIDLSVHSASRISNPKFELCLHYLVIRCVLLSLASVRNYVAERQVDLGYVPGSS